MSPPTLVVPARTLRAGEASARTEVTPEPRVEASAGQRRIGILGGTFDPPHLGHLWLATLATEALGLDRVLFMPAGQPPHKPRRRISSTSDRLLMTRLAIAGDPAFELCPIELERPGPSYTVDSVEELLRLYADGTQLFLLMSAEALAQIDTWREPDRLLALIEWAVGPRAGGPPPERSALARRFGEAAARIHLLAGPSLDISSSEIRRRVADGHAIRYLVPRSVEELIRDRGLYRTRRP